MLGHSQTKERDNREPKLRPKPARQSSTLLMSGDWKRNYGANCDTGIGESSRKQYSLAAYGHRASRRLYWRAGFESGALRPMASPVHRTKAASDDAKRGWHAPAMRECGAG